MGALPGADLGRGDRLRGEERHAGQGQAGAAARDVVAALPGRSEPVQQRRQPLARQRAQPGLVGVQQRVRKRVEAHLRA